MLHQARAPPNPDLPRRAARAAEHHRGSAGAPLLVAPLHCTKSNAPNPGVITSNKKPFFSTLPFSVLGQTEPILILNLNSCTPCTKYQVVCSYTHRGTFHIHFNSTSRSWCPPPTCRQAARFMEIACMGQAAWLYFGHHLAKPGRRMHKSWASTSSSCPSINNCQVPGTFTQGCPRT